MTINDWAAVVIGLAIVLSVVITIVRGARYFDDDFYDYD